MLSLKEIKKIIRNINIEIFEEDMEIIIVQSLKLCQAIKNESKKDSNNKEYAIIYKKFVDSIEKEYRPKFKYIMDFSVRLLIHEIYQTIESPNEIKIDITDLEKLSSKKRKHFLLAKEIAEKILKIYYYSECSEKLIISYIDDFIPDTYTKPEDLDYVIWYFLICIISCYEYILKQKEK